MWRFAVLLLPGVWLAVAQAGARQAWPGGVFGPAEFRENGAEVALRFFGELRRAFGTLEFVEAEQKAWA